MKLRLPTRSSAALALAAAALLIVSLWRTADRPVRASEAEAEDYASPIEVVLSPDGARLYVLCQQSERGPRAGCG